MIDSKIDKLFFGFILLNLFFVFTEISFSASIPAQIPELEQQVSLDIKPAFPQPEEKVKISLSAYGTNLNNATFTWKVNGTTAITGTGKTTFELLAGKAGETKTVEVTIIPADGGKIVKTIKISPQNIDLIWESRTYTPPFYKGKAMFSPQEKIKVVAIPNFIAENGSVISPSNLVYNWKKDYSVDAKQSGYASNIFTTNGSILLKPMTISVEVANTSGQKAKKELILTPVYPKTFLYERSPLYGLLLNKAIYGDNNLANGQEITVEAFPYYFGANKKSASNLSYEWNINGSKINIPPTQSGLTLKNTTGQSGKSSFGVKIKNTSNFLQESLLNSSLEFNTPQNTFN